MGQVWDSWAPWPALLAHSRPVSAGFAFYGAGWAVYSHFVARGVDVVFPKNTPMEIRFGTHDGSAPAHPGNNFVSQAAETLTRFLERFTLYSRCPYLTWKLLRSSKVVSRGRWCRHGRIGLSRQHRDDRTGKLVRIRQHQRDLPHLGFGQALIEARHSRQPNPIRHFPECFAGRIVGNTLPME